MPAFETMDRKQKAVYWAFEGPNNINEPTFATPTSIMVRWVRSDRQAASAGGKPVSISVDAITNFEAPVGSLMWIAPDNSRGSKAALDQWYDDSGSAGHTEDLMEVIDVAVTPSLKANWTRWQHGLAFYKREVVNES
jgi:hypothetical protein